MPELKVVFETDPAPVLEAVRSQRRSEPEAVQLALQAYRLSFRTSYDQFLCLPTLRDVRSLWYQEDTARKVMKNFRGRAILADEVGLGKTIEAGIVLKEYLLRGLVHTALVLAPSSLVAQWQEELAGKFGISFISIQDELFRQDPDRFWAEPFILASLQTARSKRHFPAVTSRAYDLVVVDEAHHLKNRATQNWKLVNAIQKTFLLMLTATPVQNSLEELYNLVTLLRPGHLKTQHRISHAVYRGGLTPAQKQVALQTFRDGCPVLLATGTGGEGHNLQFCHVMLNYDLPWNPMEIEQRIGRLHRIGQENEVQVYNFCTGGSIEDHILEVLDKKINMFELVVGEIDMILGRLQGEEEFSDLVYDLWVHHPEEDERRQAFEALARRLKQARAAHEKSKELDEKLFQEDFGV